MSEVIRITTTADKAGLIYDALDAMIANSPERVLAESPLREARDEVREALGQPERKRRFNQTLKDMGHPDPQEPERNTDGYDEYTETHPAYAMIGAVRWQSSGGALVGSDFTHRAGITITVKRARLHRSLSHDWWSSAGAGPEIVEVSLSEAQWATFVSAIGQGDGVPCTLNWTETDGHVPDYVPVTNRREQFNDEVKGTLVDAVKALDSILDGKPTKAVREAVEKARRELVSNIPFVVKSADEHMEQTVERAKIEVAAYVTAAVQRAGLDAIADGQPIKMLVAHSDRPENQS